MHKLELEDGKVALWEHARDKARELRSRHGVPRTRVDLERLLADSNATRFPVTIVFDSSRLDPGYFGAALPLGAEPRSGYQIVIHETFRDQENVLPLLVLYHLVSVNYGDFARGRDAEIFAATLLDMDPEDYYQKICHLADSLTQHGQEPSP